MVSSVTASRGLNFDPVKTQEYPLNGRQEYMLLALTPGVIFTQEQFGATGFSGTRGWDVNNKYRINGGREGTSQFLLNGAPISDKDGNWQLSPNVEAVQEFKVMTNTYDSQYGRLGGGAVNTTVKSGTNGWHGDGFEYFRNSFLDANTTQNNRVGAARGKHNQHQFGGVIGGAIRKDKDFIFGSFEGWREVIPFNRVSDVPPLPLRDGQHFSDFGIQIYDPLSTHRCATPEPCQGSTYIRDPFPRNVIPANRISPIGQKIISYYPAPNGNLSALNQNFFATANVGRYRYDQPIFRWDHVIGDYDKFYALFTFQHGHEFRNQSGFAPPAEYGDIFSQRTDQNYIADWTHVLSPTAVLDVRGSFGRFTSFFPDTEAFDFTADKLGITQVFHAPTVNTNTVPIVNVNTYTRLFGNQFSWNTYNQWEFAPSLSWTKGQHNLHIGFEYSYVAKANAGPGRANGSFTFDDFWTRQLSDKGQGSKDGNPIATLLLGLPSGGTPTGGFVDFNDSYYRTRPYYAGYIQDDWKATNRLTFNLGLRYDVQVPWIERYDRSNAGFDFVDKNPLSDRIIANWSKLKQQYDAANPNAQYKYPDPPNAILGGLQFPGKGGLPRRLYDTDWSDIQPRFGFAWSALPKTVVRGGFGIYYRSPSQEDTTTGFNQQTPYIRSLDGILPSGGLTGPYSLQQPFPNGIIPLAGSSLGLLTNIGNGSIAYDSRNLVNPRTYQYSFTLERELPWSIVAEASYVGSQTVHDAFGLQQDNVSYANFLLGQKDSNYLNRSLPNPFFGVLPSNSNSGSGPNITAYELLRPLPTFRGVKNNIFPWTHYRYDALQVKIEKRLLGGKNTGVMTWVLAYTFAKSFEANHLLNDWNLNERPIHEVDNQDKPQNIAFSGVWDLPFGTGHKLLNNNNRIGKILTNDWRFDWVLTYYSGYPVGWPDLVNNCASWHAATQTPDHWFNNDKSCYQTRPPYTLRVVPDRFPNIRNPAVPQLNIAIEKIFHMGERYSFLLRGESFNITNTPLLQGPNTDINNSQFGRLPLTQNNFPRLVQLAAKFMF